MRQSVERRPAGTRDSDGVVADKNATLGGGHIRGGIIGTLILPAVLLEPLVEFCCTGRKNGSDRGVSPASRAKMVLAACPMVAVTRWLRMDSHAVAACGFSAWLQRSVKQGLEFGPLFFVGHEPPAVGENPFGVAENAAQDEVGDCGVVGLCGLADKLLLAGADPKIQPLVARGFRDGDVDTGDGYLTRMCTYIVCTSCEVCKASAWASRDGATIPRTPYHR